MQPLRCAGDTEGLRLPPFNRWFGQRMQAQHLERLRCNKLTRGHSWSNMGNPVSPKPTPALGALLCTIPPAPPSDGVHLNTPKPQCCPVPHPSTGQCPPPHAPFPPFGWGQVQPLVNTPSLMAPGGRFGARIRRAGGLSAFPQQRRGETLGAGQPSHAPGRPLPSASPGTKRHALFRLCSRGPSIES